MRRRREETDPPIRPQLYVSVMLVMLILILGFTGQWDWAFAVFIALLLGNGLSALMSGR
ncbi:MAG: hypothetical protein JXA09_05195 [Anaerolineae bacterium]|nr:hypothetical protein [Anaerolineae bacterium]